MGAVGSFLDYLFEAFERTYCFQPFERTDICRRNELSTKTNRLHNLKRTRVVESFISFGIFCCMSAAQLRIGKQCYVTCEEENNFFCYLLTFAFLTGPVLVALVKTRPCLALADYTPPTQLSDVTPLRWRFCRHRACADAFAFSDLASANMQCPHKVRASAGLFVYTLLRRSC